MTFLFQFVHLLISAFHFLLKEVSEVASFINLTNTINAKNIDITPTVDLSQKKMQRKLSYGSLQEGRPISISCVHLLSSFRCSYT